MKLFVFSAKKILVSGFQPNKNCMKKRNKLTLFAGIESHSYSAECSIGKELHVVRLPINYKLVKSPYLETSLFCVSVNISDDPPPRSYIPSFLQNLYFLIFNAELLENVHILDTTV